MNRAALFLLILAFPTLSASQSDAPIVKPEIRAGDRWTYRSTNVLGPGTHEHESVVSFADGKVILLISTRKNDGKEFDSSWTSDWNAVTSYTGRSYRPNVGHFRFLLRIGDSYEAKYEFRLPRMSEITSIATATIKVAGWDMVEVPAGKFRAMRVETKSVFLSHDGRNTTRRVQTNYWYAPEVRRWVKLQQVAPDFTASEELLSYKLNED